MVLRKGSIVFFRLHLMLQNSNLISRAWWITQMVCLIPCNTRSLLMSLHKLTSMLGPFSKIPDVIESVKLN